jgi:hypothetical protein
MRELTAEDFKKAMPNPFYDKLIKEVVVPIKREDYAVFEKIAKINDEPVEILIKRCLHMTAEEFQETD